MIIFKTDFSVTIFSRPMTTPAPDWTEIDTGPGDIQLPEGHEYGFRIHQLTDDQLESLAAELAVLPNLTYANLSENRKITDEALEYLRMLPNLTYLNLSSCDLRNDGLVHLQALPRLTTLDLSFCNRFTGVGLKHLRAMPRLQFLSLQGCIRITHGDVARLRRPGLTIKE